jgi:prepilin-type processing-associated H-X9-DG protein
MYASESKGEKWPSQAKRAGDACESVAMKNVFDGPSVYPEYLSDVKVLICPSDPEATADEPSFMHDGQVFPCSFTDLCYSYWGYAILPEHYLVRGGDDNASPADDELDMTGWLAVMSGIYTPAYTTPVEDADSLYEADVTFTDGEGVSQTLYRLREGIERFLISNINNAAATSMAQSELAVYWDQVGVSTIRAKDGSVNFNHAPGGGNVLYMDGHVEFVKFSTRFPISRGWVTLMQELDTMW